MAKARNTKAKLKGDLDAFPQVPLVKEDDASPDNVLQFLRMVAAHVPHCVCHPVFLFANAAKTRRWYRLNWVRTTEVEGSFVRQHSITKSEMVCVVVVKDGLSLARSPKN